MFTRLTGVLVCLLPACACVFLHSCCGACSGQVHLLT